MSAFRRRGRADLPDVVRSASGGQLRDVRAEWRPTPPRDGQVRVKGPARTALAHLALLGYLVLLAVPLVLIALLLPRPGEGDRPPLVELWVGLGLVWAGAALHRLYRLVRAVPDLWRREVVVGAVVRHAVEARDPGSGALTGYSYYLGADDGRRGLVTMFCTGFEPWSPGRPPGSNPYHSLVRGDVVRLTVAPGSGSVLQVEPLAGAEGGPPPSLRVSPFVPVGAPLTAKQVAAGTSSAVRRVAHHHAGAANCVDVYVYHLIDDVPARLEVFVCRSRTALADVRAATRAVDGAPEKRTTYPSERYPGGLLIGGVKGVAVGVRPPGPGRRGAPWASDVHLLEEALRTLTKR